MDLLIQRRTMKINLINKFLKIPICPLSSPKQKNSTKQKKQQTKQKQKDSPSAYTVKSHSMSRSWCSY